MKRLLVIRDVGLWVSLNRQYAGNSGVRVLEVPALDAGIRLTQVELPDLVVCRTDADPRSVQDIDDAFQEAGLENQQIVYVCDSPEAVDVLGRERDKRAVCSADSLSSWVEKFVAATPKRGNTARVLLLAHYERHSELPGEIDRGFVNLLEIQRRSILVEASQSLEAGDQLSLTFYLPRMKEIEGTGDRVQIVLECEISRCTDADKMLYRAIVKSIDPRSDASLRRFIEAHDQPGESS